MSSGTTGAQDWRAVACLAPSGERLLCVGESSSQVRAAYTGAWGEVIRDEDRPTVRAISLQRWTGQFWSGQWEHQSYLAVPTARGSKNRVRRFGGRRSRSGSRAGSGSGVRRGTGCGQSQEEVDVRTGRHRWSRGSDSDWLAQTVSSQKAPAILAARSSTPRRSVA